MLGNLASFRPGPPCALGAAGRKRVHPGRDGRARRHGGRVAAGRAGRAHPGPDAASEVRAGSVPPSTSSSSRWLLSSGHDRQLVWGAPEDGDGSWTGCRFHLHPETLRGAATLPEGSAAAQRPAGRRRAGASRVRGVRARSRLPRARGSWASGRRPWRRSKGTLARSLRPWDGRFRARFCGIIRRDGVAVGRTRDPGGSPARGAARLRAAGSAHAATPPVGPHRHDLVLTVHGTPAREVLSAGQGKLLATALKLTAMALLGQVTGRTPDRGL